MRDGLVDDQVDLQEDVSHMSNRWWPRAFTLAERAALRRGQSGSQAGEPAAAGGASRANRWRSQRPFDRPELLARRLRIDGLTEIEFDALVDTLQVQPEIENTVWESLALANAMTAMATSRRYAWHSIGALGVIELTAPGRSAHVATGLKRIGLSERERRYFDLHAVLDFKHSLAWNAEVLWPAIVEDPRRAQAIAEGALVRLNCGARCFNRYREILWSCPIHP